MVAAIIAISLMRVGLNNFTEQIRTRGVAFQMWITFAAAISDSVAFLEAAILNAQLDRCRCILRRRNCVVQGISRPSAPIHSDNLHAGSESGLRCRQLRIDIENRAFRADHQTNGVRRVNELSLLLSELQFVVWLLVIN